MYVLYMCIYVYIYIYLNVYIHESEEGERERERERAAASTAELHLVGLGGAPPRRPVRAACRRRCQQRRSDAEARLFNDALWGVWNCGIIMS